ncbi:hypothetical protein ACYOEI_38075, partial [Singulisphaera rosea]
MRSTPATHFWDVAANAHRNPFLRKKQVSGLRRKAMVEAPSPRLQSLEISVTFRGPSVPVFLSRRAETMATTDAEALLVRQVRAGDALAWRQLIER